MIKYKPSPYRVTVLLPDFDWIKEEQAISACFCQIFMLNYYHGGDDHAKKSN